MIIDYGQVTPPQGVIAFPDYAVFGTPLEPEQIVETVYVQGSSITGSTIGGNVDTPQ